MSLFRAVMWQTHPGVSPLRLQTAGAGEALEQLEALWSLPFYTAARPRSTGRGGLRA